MNRSAFDPPFGLERQGLHRRVPVVRDVAVELLVLLVGDLRGRPRPDRLHRVQSDLFDDLLLGARDRFAVVIALGLADRLLHPDRVGDEVGVALDERLDDLRIGVVVETVLRIGGFEMQRHRGAAHEAAVVGQGVLPFATRLPTGRVLLAGPPRHHGDLVGHHEGRVEADAELADEVVEALRRVARAHPVDQLAGARLGDRAEVLHHLLAAHADAVVGDLQGARLRVGRDADLQHLGPLHDPLVGQRLEAQAVEGVRGVRDELAQEDLLVRVERVDDDVQQLPRLGLELVGLGLRAHLLRLLSFCHPRRSPGPRAASRSSLPD